MKSKMSPREALYYICLELGPRPKTNRGDNITHREAKIRDAVRTLQNFIEYQQPSGDSFDGFELDEFRHHTHEHQLGLDLGDTE